MRRLLLSAFLLAGCGRALPTPTNEPDMAESRPACSAPGDPCCFGGDGAPHCAAGLACAVEGSLLRCQAVACGRFGQPCCEDVTPPDCGAGMVCEKRAPSPSAICWER